MILRFPQQSWKMRGGGPEAGRQHGERRIWRLGLVLGLVLTLLGPLDAARPPVARADQTVVIDFETGPALDTTPVTDEYSATSFVRFIQEDPGFRPVRRSVGPGRAHSGSDVVDVGADVCLIDGNPGQDCEFPGAGTQGRLSHTAKSVTVFAGLLIHRPGRLLPASSLCALMAARRPQARRSLSTQLTSGRRLPSRVRRRTSQPSPCARKDRDLMAARRSASTTSP